MTKKHDSSRAVLNKPIKLTFGVKQRDIISTHVNEANITPHDFILTAGLEAASVLLKTKNL